MRYFFEFLYVFFFHRRIGTCFIVPINPLPALVIRILFHSGVLLIQSRLISIINVIPHFITPQFLQWSYLVECFVPIIHITASHQIRTIKTESFDCVLVGCQCFCQFDSCSISTSIRSTKVIWDSWISQSIQSQHPWRVIHIHQSSFNRWRQMENRLPCPFRHLQKKTTFLSWCYWTRLSIYVATRHLLHHKSIEEQQFLTRRILSLQEAKERGIKDIITTWWVHLLFKTSLYTYDVLFGMSFMLALYSNSIQLLPCIQAFTRRRMCTNWTPVEWCVCRLKSDQNSHAGGDQLSIS